MGWQAARCHRVNKHRCLLFCILSKIRIGLYAVFAPGQEKNRFKRTENAIKTIKEAKRLPNDFYDNAYCNRLRGCHTLALAFYPSILVVLASEASGKEVHKMKDNEREYGIASEATNSGVSIGNNENAYDDLLKKLADSPDPIFKDCDKVEF